jgi:two-component system chemotaxis response regulator CheB
VIKVRVLVVDDSASYRRILTDALGGDASIEVVGSAPNGRIALQKIPQVNPDVVTLDVEMPEMDGLETLRALRADYPTLPVIMVSTVTEPGAEATIDALLRGANDYCTKPMDAEGAATLKRDLLPKVLRLGQAYLQACRSPAGGSSMPPMKLGSVLPSASRSTPAGRPGAPATQQRSRPAAGRVEVIAIGVSTGGPNALANVFAALPGDLDVPVVIVQHMPPLFTASLAQRLDPVSQLVVREGQAGDPLRPNWAYIAPGNFHMTVGRERGNPALALNQGPPENSCRPAVDVLFRSVAELYGPNVLAVVMTGMGQDGQRGAEHVRDAGGEVWAQDEASSVVWGMPGAVVRAGLADRVLPLERIGTEIGRRARERRSGLGQPRAGS